MRRAILYTILISLSACATTKMPEYASSEKSFDRVPAEYAPVPEQFSNIIAGRYRDGDTYSELQEMIDKRDWLGVRVKAALEAIKGMGLYIIHPDIYCDADFSKRCPAGVIKKEVYERDYANKTLYTGLVYMRSGHKFYTKGEMINPVAAYALSYLGRMGYDFDEQTGQYRSVARPGL